MLKKDLFLGISPEELKKRKKAQQPTFLAPMLATLTTDYFSSKEWIYEQKYDGERCLAFKHNGKVTLKSRNNRIINTEYPELVQALELQKADNFIIDGEIIAVNKKGVSSFQLLQGRINLQNKAQISARIKAIPIYFCIFDVLYVEGYDIRALSLVARKIILKKLLIYKKVLRYSSHRSPNGLIYYKKACNLH